MNFDLTEKHFTVPELAKLWRLGESTLRNWFRDEPGVLKFGHESVRRRKTKNYMSLRIPESVARRVYERHLQRAANRPFQNDRIDLSPSPRSAAQ